MVPNRPPSPMRLTLEVEETLLEGEFILRVGSGEEVPPRGPDQAI